MKELHIEFVLEFEEKPIVLRYCIGITRQLQVILIISSAALWPSSLPCLSVIFFLNNTKQTWRKFMEFHFGEYSDNLTREFKIH